MINLWKWLDGKKSKFALIYWAVVLPALPVIFDSGVPDSVEKATTILGYVFAAFGLGHAGVKGMKK